MNGVSHVHRGGEFAMGTLHSIFIADNPGGPMRQAFSINAVAGRGLECDRYFNGNGSFSRWPSGGRAISLIAVEAIEAIANEHNIDLSNGRSRRNLVTRDVKLEALVDRHFTIGNVILFGSRLCAPCRYLERLVAPGLYDAIKGRGGLRADVIQGGTIREQDALTVVSERRYSTA